MARNASQETLRHSLGAFSIKQLRESNVTKGQ